MVFCNYLPFITFEKENQKMHENHSISKLSLAFSSISYRVESDENISNQQLPLTTSSVQFNSVTTVNLDDLVIYVMLNNIAEKRTNSISKININSLSLHRTVTLIKNKKSFLEILSQIKKLKQLDLSGNKAGPVAFRALIATLLKHDIVEELNMADNDGDHDCPELIRQYLSNSKSLRALNISDNLLGRSSLPRSLAAALRNNNNLVDLNVSNCGITNLHILFEGLRSTLSLKTPALKCLNVSNNLCHNGEQLGLAISLVLGHKRCHIRKLNIANVGLSPLGWESIASVFKSCHSIRELKAGGSFNKIKNILQIIDILFVNKNLRKLDLKDLRSEEIITIRKKTSTTMFSYLYSIANSSLTDINLSNTNLTNNFIALLANRYPGKLSSVRSLDLSCNHELDSTMMGDLKKILSVEDECHLHSLNFSQLKLNQAFPIVNRFFPLMISLNLSKSELSPSEFSSSITKNHSSFLEELSLNGIEKDQLVNFFSVIDYPFFEYLVALSLSECCLFDDDFQLLISKIFTKTSVSLNLKQLNVSHNYLEKGLSLLALCLLETENYPLESLNVAWNMIDDNGVIELCNFIKSPKTNSKLKTLDISGNNLSKTGLHALVECLILKNGKRGLVDLDASSQQNVLADEDIKNIDKTFSDFICLKDESVLLDQKTMPLSQVHINLNNLGGCLCSSIKPLLHIGSISSDILNQVKSFACLSDYLLFAAALDNNFTDESTSITQFCTTAAFPINLWTEIVGLNSPSWLKIETKRSRTIYINHLPQTVDEDSLQSTLETVKECSVEKVFFIKDTAFKKTTGAAWVLLHNKQSVDKIMNWFLNKRAKISGHPISISNIPVSVLKVEEIIHHLNEKEKCERNILKTQELDKKDLQKSDKPSILIEDEYDAYLDNLNFRRIC